MSTQAQTLANRANSKLSTGPTSDQGKAASSQNNFRHGLSGSFSVLPSEDRNQFNAMQNSLISEHQPATPTESILVEKMAQSYWRRQRALQLQNTCFTAEPAAPDAGKQLALYLRYQVTASKKAICKSHLFNDLAGNVVSRNGLSSRVAFFISSL